MTRARRVPVHTYTYFLLLHEAHEGGALDLHGLPLPVVQSQHEVEEVGFPQVGRRLLLEMSPGQAYPAVAKETELGALKPSQETSH